MYLHKSLAHEATIPDFLQERPIENTKETYVYSKETYSDTKEAQISAHTSP